MTITARDWRTQARCRDTDPEAFFPLTNTLMEEVAKAVCRTCPARRDCLQYALDAGEKHGIWGGLTEAERRNPRQVALALGAAA